MQDCVQDPNAHPNAFAANEQSQTNLIPFETHFISNLYSTNQHDSDWMEGKKMLSV